MLYIAAWLGNVSMLQLLVDNNAHLDARNHNGATAALAAAWYGHAVCLQALHVAGADLELATMSGNTCLMMAAAHGHGACVEYLVCVARVDRSCLGPGGKTALMRAVEAGVDDEILAVLRSGTPHK